MGKGACTWARGHMHGQQGMCMGSGADVFDVYIYGQEGIYMDMHACIQSVEHAVKVEEVGGND